METISNRRSINVQISLISVVSHPIGCTDPPLKSESIATEFHTCYLTYCKKKVNTRLN